MQLLFLIQGWRHRHSRRLSKRNRHRDMQEWSFERNRGNSSWNKSIKKKRTHKKRKCLWLDKKSFRVFSSFDILLFWPPDSYICFLWSPWQLYTFFFSQWIKGLRTHAISLLTTSSQTDCRNSGCAVKLINYRPKIRVRTAGCHLESAQKSLWCLGWPKKFSHLVALQSIKLQSCHKMPHEAR